MPVDPHVAYRETKIKTANPAQLVVMLYNEAVKQCDIALDLMAKTDKPSPESIERINIALVKVQDIVTELMASLDFEAGGDIANDLFALYVWFNREILDANIKKDSSRIGAVRNMLNELRGAWTEAAAKTKPDNGAAHVGVNIAG